MKTLTIFAIFLTITAYACKKENSLANDQTFEIKYGEPANYADNTLVITLDSVLNDSRCPKNVNCIWAGNAEVRFTYSKENDKVKFVLNTFSQFRTDTLIDGYRIKLINLTPYPEAGIIINHDDYKAEIKITKE